MIQLQQVDKNVTVQQQLADTSEGPVVLVNVITCSPNNVAAVLEAWIDDAAYFRAQPGLISAQLHRGIAGSSTFLNYAVWESLSAYRAAATNPAFQTKLANYPDGTVAAPHIYRKVAVKGICTT